jgi:hypothetical protein
MPLSDALRQHYLSFSTYTYPGPYIDYIESEIPDDPRKFGPLLRRNIIHRVTLKNGNTGSNADLRYGDMRNVPWWRQAEDDVLVTTAAMISELFRRDHRGLVLDRKEADRLVVTCRYVAVLTAAILKSKGIPARVRSGFESYAVPTPRVSCDHWITQYWSDVADRWFSIDVDCCLEDLDFDPFDLPKDKFEFAADSWLRVRGGSVDLARFYNGGGYTGLVILAWELLYDFHSLMNSEIYYLHTPAQLRIENFDKISKRQLSELDRLAELMLDPDQNYGALESIWQSDRELRLLTGGLL